MGEGVAGGGSGRGGLVSPDGLVHLHLRTPPHRGILRRPALACLAARLRILRLSPEADPAQVASRFAADPRIEAAEIPVPARLLFTPNDPYFPQQWHLAHVGAPAAWDHVRDPVTRSAVVGVIDTGLDLDEPDLGPSLWINEAEDLDHDGRLGPGDLDGVDQDGNGFIDDVVGWDFAGNDPEPQATYVHGSGVSACISAATDNGVGGAGLGFGVRLMVLKGIADGGYLAEGYIPMLYAADNGAGVVNCSWGVPVYRAYEQAIVDAVWGEDVVIVASGGDGSQIVYPAGYDHVFEVSATDSQDRRASFAPYGTNVDICAPGVNILTLWDGDMEILSGTSFASGMVAGLAGLVRAADPTIDAAGAVELIENTAVSIDALNPGYEGLLGAGRIDAHAAITSVITAVDLGGVSGVAGARLQCDPNPFSGSTVVRWEIDRAGPVAIEVFDVRGRRTTELASRQVGEARMAGTVTWTTTDLAAGVYWVRLTAGDRRAVRSVTLVR